ncbi:MAG: phosphatidate cytidylyltransferase [Thermoguttaceae bacterium]|jgi:phosphatidate cytidylyltransferase
MLCWRLLLGTLLIAAVAGLCWLDARSAIPGLWLMPLLVAVTLLATQEVLWLLRARGSRPLAWTVYAGNLLIVLGSWTPLLPTAVGLRYTPLRFFLPPAGPPIAILVIAILMVLWGEMARGRRPNGNSPLPLGGERQGTAAAPHSEGNHLPATSHQPPATLATPATPQAAGNNGALANCAGGVFALVYVGLMLAIAVQIRLGIGLFALAAWIITVKMGDIGAYTVGRLIGRHKLAPTISPGKTVEGAFGAVLFACLGSWSAAVFLPLWLPGRCDILLVLSLLFYFGPLMALAGMAGDLFESLLKRDAGCKDSSPWLPGFGGVLDIIDSLLLSAPVAWLLWGTLAPLSW